jgi:hypothetical protein
MAVARYAREKHLRLDLRRPWLRQKFLGHRLGVSGGDGDALPRPPEEYLNRAKDRERQAAEEEATLAKIKKVVANLQREEASIRNQMLVP